MAKLKPGKGIRVRILLPGWKGQEGEICRNLRSYGMPDEYDIRLGPSHFVQLHRRDFQLIDPIIRFSDLVKLRATY